MRRRGEREARESRLASGWIVEGDARPDSGATASTDAPTAAATAAPSGSEPVPVPEATRDPAGEAAPTAPAQMSTGVLILLGVVGGVYLLYTWVWFSWANYYASLNAVVAEGSGDLGAVLQQVVYWAAPLAPILWFIAVVAVVGSARARALMTWLLVGVVVLLPVPMLTGGGAS